MVTIATMTFEEYKDIEHPAPYVLQLEGGSGARLLYYGARHCWDPSDPMFGGIQARFCEFQPHIVLIEGGGLRPLRPDPDEEIKQFGEGGYVSFLSHAHSVPVLDLEPPFDSEMKHLLASFPKEHLLLYYCVRQIVQYRHTQSKPSYEEYVEVYARWYAQRLHFDTAVSPLAVFHALYEEEFGRELDWEAISEEAVSPLVYDSFLNQVDRQSGYFRNSSHVAALLEAVKAHQKTFAIAGASHVVMQEQALRTAFASV